jgi:hypothetical protein
MKNGEGTFIKSNEESYSGSWKDDLKHGYGIEQSSLGIYSGYFIDDLKADESGKFKYSNGDSYDGQFTSGIREGKGIFKFSNGDVYSGEFMNDQINGFGSIEFLNGNFCKGTFKDGLLDGQGEFKHSFNKDKIDFIAKFIGNYSEGKMHGKGELSFYNGDKFSGSFIGDSMHHGKTYICCFFLFSINRS